MISKSNKNPRKKSAIYNFFFPEEVLKQKAVLNSGNNLDRKYNIVKRLENVFFVALLILFIVVIIFSFINMVSPKTEVYSVPESLTKYTDIDKLKSHSANVESEQTDIHTTESEPIESKRAISCWSDSFGVSNSESVTPYTSVLGSLVGRLVFNISVTDDDIDMISARQGSSPMYVAPLYIPGDIQSVEITLKSADGTPLTPHFDYNGGLNPCSINDITGVISNIGGKLYFTRSASGSDSIVQTPTQVITRAMLEKRSDITIFFIGSDDMYSDADKTLAKYQSMVNYLDPTDKQFLIVSPVVGSKEDLDAIDSKMSTYFGNRYLNFRQYLLTDAVADYNLQINTISQQYLDRGELPEAFFSGRDNLETTINYILAQKIYERLGILNALS